MPRRRGLVESPIASDSRVPTDGPDADDQVTVMHTPSRAKPSRQVLTESVYAVVKEQIMDLQLAPGARINMDQLARDLEVSNTPLREVLTRLESEGLVTRRSLQGYSVVPLPDRCNLDELFGLRVILEPEAARLAATRLTPAHALLLKSTIDQMLEVRESQIPGEQYRRYRLLIDSDALFHDTVAQASDNKLMQRTIVGLHAHVLQYRLYFRIGRAPEESPTIEEHRAVMDALLAHDAHRAAIAMRTHLEQSHKRIAPLCIFP